MRLIRPNRNELLALFGKEVRGIWVCSPWISAAGVKMLRESLHRCDLTILKEFELWIRMDARDQQCGLTDYSAVNMLLNEIVRSADSARISLWTAPNLHAKVFWTDLGVLIGSANLTSSGFVSNVEIAVRLEREESIPQASVREALRQDLKEVSSQRWQEFVASLNVGGTDEQPVLETPPASGSYEGSAWEDLMRELLSERPSFDRGIR